MNRKLRPAKSPYQIKEEQINFLLEDIEKYIKNIKKIIEKKDKQLAETKKILQGSKTQLPELNRRKKQPWQYIVSIRQQQQQQKKR